NAFRVQTPLAVAASTIAGCGLIWAVMMVSQDRLTIGDLSVFVASISGLQSAVGTLVGGISDIVQSSLSFRYYLAVVGAPADLPRAAHPEDVGPLRHHIKFHDVWFRYHENTPWVLQGVNLTVEVGKTLALVGLNGSGKSTLVKLLCRLYDPTKGSITWDGRDLRDFDPDELRSQLGAVFQDYMAYDLTAAENIGIGAVGDIQDQSAVTRAADAAGVHEAVSELPHGYDTLLSRIFFAGDGDNPELGVHLSGGQWQRLAFARGLMRARADLMILDEPNAGLDAEAEADVHARLHAHRQGRTSLLISHRMSAIRSADSIAVLRNGIISELGTHDQLIEQRGEYARLFELQAAGYQEMVEPA
ncbi:ATP-binding cassette domain-containing protein, partial [Streptomyces sp900116325]|uniref:ABC transporter ATP-binding protein n=1 Tax=Streptomyces sp. 900116325 TaxID=3154295 RepID=UPI0033CD434B